MESELHPILKTMSLMADQMANFWGKNCEISIYQLDNNRYKITYISKSKVTNRVLGDEISKEEMEKINNTTGVMSLNNTKDGRIIKSSIIPIKDDKENLIGFMSINYDITELMVAKNFLEDLGGICPQGYQAEDSKNQSIHNILYEFVDNCLDDVGKPVTYLNKEEKVQIVKRLNEQGVFLIKGSVDYLAEKLCVSRYTIYNYLEEIKE